MTKREQQQSFIERNSTPLGSFAEAAFTECGRGAIFIRWPDDGTRDWIYMAEEELFRCFKQIQLTPEEVEGDDLLRALREYDSNWEAIIVFLNDIERRIDVHQVGFIPEGPYENIFAPAR